MAQVPRGIRNNNPLNIRIGNAWIGEVPFPNDNEFEQFVSPRWGFRAAFVILRRYIKRYHLNTVELIVSRWAPRSENDTEAYVDAVVLTSGIRHGDIISFEDREQMVRLAVAMARVECGCPVSIKDAYQGYDLAARNSTV